MACTRRRTATSAATRSRWVGCRLRQTTSFASSARLRPNAGSDEQQATTQKPVHGPSTSSEGAGRPTGKAPLRELHEAWRPLGFVRTQSRRHLQRHTRHGPMAVSEGFSMKRAIIDLSSVIWTKLLGGKDVELGRKV